VITPAALAAQLEARGHRVVFPPDGDAATFEVVGLAGGPDVEVSVQDDGRLCCHYTGASEAQAAVVIARLPVPGHMNVQAVTGDTLTATWSGIEVEWEHLPAAPGVAAAALLAHLAVLDGGRDDAGDEEG
jgi:hypothetical protein